MAHGWDLSIGPWAVPWPRPFRVRVAHRRWRKAVTEHLVRSPAQPRTGGQPTEPPDRPLEERVFELLQHEGALTPVQIGVRLVEPTEHVREALEGLRQRGLAHPRRERDPNLQGDLRPWRLAFF